MITLLFFACFFIYCLPGLYLARGLYSEQVRAINKMDVQVVPLEPYKPDIRVDELVHTVSRYPPKENGHRTVDLARTCKILREQFGGEPGNVCTCDHRDEWLKVRKQWTDWNEWNKKYGHIQNGVLELPRPSIAKPLLAVPGWPILGAILFIKGGAKKIPDYREIERLERENNQLFELE